MELFDTKKTTPFALRIPIWPGTIYNVRFEAKFECIFIQGNLMISFEKKGGIL